MVGSLGNVRIRAHAVQKSTLIFGVYRLWRVESGGPLNRMFRAYLDESSEQQDAVFAVGGFVGDEREWAALESPWLNLCRPALSISSLHV